MKRRRAFGYGPGGTLGPLGVGIAGLVLLGAPAAPAAEPPDLSGSWQLDEKLSDNPQEQMRAAMERSGGMRRPGGGPGRGGFPGGGSPPGGGMGGRGRPGGGPTGGPGRGGPGGPMQLLSAAKTLQIALAAGEIQIRSDGDQASLRILRPDGEKRKKTGSDGSPIEARCEWKEGVLVVESTGGWGMKTTETYTLAPEGRLVKTLRLDDNRFKEPVYIRTYYDRKPPETPTETPEPAPQPSPTAP